jgi:hypothetical protein
MVAVNCILRFLPCGAAGCSVSGQHREVVPASSLDHSRAKPKNIESERKGGPNRNGKLWTAARNIKSLVFD